MYINGIKFQLRLNVRNWINVAKNVALQNALGPLINEIRSLKESVDTVHTDYADLKQTISKQKNELRQELVENIDNNTRQLTSIACEIDR